MAFCTYQFGTLLNAFVIRCFQDAWHSVAEKQLVSI